VSLLLPGQISRFQPAEIRSRIPNDGIMTGGANKDQGMSAVLPASEINRAV
jgi:hypothetical protein